MQLRDWAIQILSADRIEDKLFSPVSLSDDAPGPAFLWKEPSRPSHLSFTRHSGKSDRLPPFHEHHVKDNIATCLHRFCGHELLAVEIMAYALLAFPEAPRSFRMGLANTLREEQGHVRLYMTRLKELGVNFGDLPLYKHFWAHTPYLTSPLKYISMMSLTFEMANLDFAPHYGSSFKKHGDDASFALMQQILIDEISHVSFGMSWFRKLKDKDRDCFDVYKESILPILTPKRAKGFIFQKEPRQKAGVPPSWIDSLIKS